MSEKEDTTSTSTQSQSTAQSSQVKPAQPSTQGGGSSAKPLFPPLEVVRHYRIIPDKNTKPDPSDLV